MFAQNFQTAGIRGLSGMELVAVLGVVIWLWRRNVFGQ